MNAAVASPYPVSTMSRWRVRLITDVRDLERLQQDWQGFERAPTDHEAVFLQSFDWCHYVASLRSTRSPDRYRLLVAVVEDGPDIVGIWPLSRQRSSRMWIIRNLDDPFGQMAGFLCRDSDAIEPCVHAILEHVRRHGIADAVCIDNAIEGSPLHCALIASGAKTGSSNEMVQIDMRGLASFADYQRTLNAKSRKNLRNALNRLRSMHGTISDAVIDEPALLDPIVRQTFDGRLDWMRLRGKSTNAFRDADFRPLIEGVCAAPHLQLLAFQMEAFGAPIASQWGFVHQGRYYAYISARAPGYDAFSPGRIHLGSVIAACKARGLDILELMAPASRYKVMWSDRITGVHDMWIPLTVRGRLTLGILDFVLPGMHVLARALPKSLKTRLARRVNSE